MRGRSTVPIVLFLVLCAAAPSREERSYDFSHLIAASADAGPAPSMGVIDPDAEDARDRESAERREIEQQEFIDTTEKWITAFASKDEVAIDVREYADARLVFYVTATEAQHRRIAGAVEQRLSSTKTQIATDTRILTLTKDAEAALPPEVQQQFAKCRVAATQPSYAVSLDSKSARQVIEAVGKDVRSAQTIAPRISTFNRQHAYVLLGSDHEYTAGYERAGGNWEKQTGIYRDGLCLALRCTVDGQHRVELSIDAQLARLLKMNTRLFEPAEKEQLTVESPELDVRKIACKARADFGQTLLFLIPTDPKASADSDTVAYLLVTPVIRD